MLDPISCVRSKVFVCAFLFYILDSGVLVILDVFSGEKFYFFECGLIGTFVQAKNHLDVITEAFFDSQETSPFLVILHIGFQVIHMEYRRWLIVDKPVV